MNSALVILQALAFLGTVVLLAGLGLGVVVALLNGRKPLARWLAVAASVLASGYVAVVLLASLFSHEEILAVGTPKYFCEIDCHVTIAVVGMSRSDTIGGTRAEGEFYLVTVKTWFDPSTTSPTRPKDAVVHPNPHLVRLIDRTGKEFALSESGMAALQRTGAAGTPITQPLLPDASYTTTLAFDLPVAAAQPRLWITNNERVTELLIGAERSPFHSKVLLALPGS
jgi:hypothetical protein